MSEAQQPKRGRGLIVGLILTFAAGLLAMAWLLTGTEVGRGMIQPYAKREANPDTVPVRALADAKPVADGPAIAVPPSADVAFRLASLEARLASLEARPSAGGGASSPRVEALLLTLTASRRLERGESFGGLEGELAARFGATEPQSIAALSAWSAAPIQLADLQTSFEKLAPTLASGDGWWDQLTSSLGSLIVVRDQTTAATAPAQAVNEARSLVQSGKIEAALHRVRTLPKTPEGNQWMGDALRLVNAQKAMAALESRALSLTVTAPVILKPVEAPASDMPLNAL